ncbi:MAG: hypothetical protein H8E85_00465 [Candidatus Marinimicrobia bacterium]|nr:hypothetical protein [Candidatus Neomarinimicrobiota bacterium]
MLYRILTIILTFSILSGQSLFNRWTGTDPFVGSARSTAMGTTHLLNSTASNNVRFNPAKLSLLISKRELSIQVNRSSVFERWSMPVRDSFGEFLTSADYVANEFNYYDVNLGLIGTVNITSMGKIGIGFNYAPLTHFTYQYSEEVRGSYSIEDGEYASKDPIVGYQNLSVEGKLMLASIGGGINLAILGDIEMSVGGALNLIQSAKLKDRVEVDTLYSDVTNLTTLPDYSSTSELPAANFLTFSTNLKLNSNINLGASWEADANITSSQYNWEIDSTNGLFQYWGDSSFVISGLNYMKPDIKSFAFSYSSNTQQIMSIDFEVDQVSYKKHLIFQDYKQFKFGFEYLTQMGTPIRGGLVYKTPLIPAMKPISMFTFGSGKTIGNLVIDYAGTYSFQSFNYPDLFPVEGDIRSENDLVRDSQLHLQLALIYKF